MKKRHTRVFWLALINVVMLVFSLVTAIVKLSPDSDITHQVGETTAPIAPLAAMQVSISDVQQSSLFNPSREAVIEDKSPIEPSAVATAPPPYLIGIVGEKGVLRALLLDTSTKTRRLVKRGEEFNGWTLISIGIKKVELQAGERIEVIDLSLSRSAPENVVDAQNKEEK